jgi:hypothetical protein
VDIFWGVRETINAVFDGTPHQSPAVTASFGVPEKQVLRGKIQGGSRFPRSRNTILVEIKTLSVH